MLVKQTCQEDCQDTSSLLINIYIINISGSQSIATTCPDAIVFGDLHDTTFLSTKALDKTKHWPSPVNI